MSHEWNCRCPRCEADEAKYTGPDPLDEAESELRYGGGEEAGDDGE